MGATSDDPPALEDPRVPDEPCAPGPERAWGWAVQVYALRSKESWGIGDFADLRRFGRWAKSTGASLALLNPLGAQLPTLPYEPSPYYPSTRRFRNVVYLRIEDIEGARQADISDLRSQAIALNANRLIDYDRVFELKAAALKRVFEAAPRRRGITSYVAREGAALREFANFNAERDVNGGTAEFHVWVQYQLDRQLANVAREIGLITDVPVGFNPDGFDARRFAGAFAPRMHVGAPPDEFFRDGQNWGLPPLDPWKLDDSRWLPFLDAIRAAGRHAAGIRLDHVMGLFRLFWIPEGVAAAHGAYVHYPSDVLLNLLANESRRAGAFVVGEDLGLVEPVVRERLHAKGSLSYRLLWFEETHPSQWPRDAVAAVGTHDLPTIAGIWSRTEPEHRLHYLRDRLAALTQMPDDADPVDVAVDAYRHIAHSAPRIALVSLEDALGVRERPNVPGTTDEMPNWRLALPVPIEEIETFDGPRRIAQAMRDAGR